MAHQRGTEVRVRLPFPQPVHRPALVGGQSLRPCREVGHAADWARRHSRRVEHDDVGPSAGSETAPFGEAEQVGLDAGEAVHCLFKRHDLAVSHPRPEEVGGLDRVYEINRNFRNEGLGWRWNPEFTMLEFYQAYANFKDVMDLTQSMIEQAVKDVTGGTKTKWGDQEIDWANWQRMTMREAIIYFWPESAGPKPQMSDFASQDSVKALVERFNAVHAHMAYDPNEPAGKTIANLFEAVAEEHLLQPTIIYEFPTAVSPLSENKPDEPDWTERWELFAGQMELANGFSELNDPEEQRRRFEQQLKERERGDQEAHQMDEDYIRALSYGMPPAGGVGVGVDRLAMLLTNSRTIRDVILFPLLRPEKAPGGEDSEGK